MDNIQAKLVKNEPMSAHTSFKIGGPADLFIEVNTTDQLKSAIEYAKQHNILFFIFGGGTNILVSDKGIRGLVIKYSSEEYWLRDGELEVSAGMGLAKIALEMISKGVSTGLEYFASVPGTVGGAVHNNSHWKDKVIKDYVLRTNISDGVILTVTLKAVPANREVMKQTIIESNNARATSQPLDQKSAGCIFVNPSKEQPAGMLIDQCGLKGKAIGGAVISQKHANFIINQDHATALDVLSLIDLEKRAVKEKFCLDLKEEIQTIGEF